MLIHVDYKIDIAAEFIFTNYNTLHFIIFIAITSYQNSISYFLPFRLHTVRNLFHRTLVIANLVHLNTTNRNYCLLSQ